MREYRNLKAEILVCDICGDKSPTSWGSKLYKCRGCKKEFCNKCGEHEGVSVELRGLKSINTDYHIPISIGEVYIDHLLLCKNCVKTKEGKEIFKKWRDNLKGIRKFLNTRLGRVK